MPRRPEPRHLAALTVGLVVLAAAAAAAPLVAGRTAAAAFMNGVIAVMCVALIVLAERRARTRPDEAFAWHVLAGVGALAALRRALATATVLEGDTTPGLTAHVPWLQPAILVVACGTFFVLASRLRSHRSGLRSGLDGFLAGSSVLFVLWAITTHVSGGLGSMTRFEATILVTDLVVIAASLGLFVDLSGSVGLQFTGPLTFVGAALVCLSANVLAIGHFGMRGLYYVGHPADAFAALAAGMVALAAHAPGSVVLEGAAAPPARRAQVASLLPYLPIIASLFTAALLLGRPDGEGDRLLTGLGVAIGIALLLRQQIALRDVEQLSHHLTETVAARSRELAAAQNALARAQRLEAVGRMAGGVARDFDRLIAELEAPVAILAGAIPAAHADREAVEEIAAAGRRAQRLTAQLLTFAQRQPVEPRRTDVNALLADALPLLRQLAGRAIAITLRTAPGSATVFADPTQLEQLLSNLTVNARDAMPGGGTLAIAVSVPGADEPPAPDGPRGPQVRIVVQDTGVGMDEETLAHVFEPFFTTKPAGKGTGLGLPTCYGIVNRAGGRIRVESRPGTGTTVTVDLPRSG